MYDYLAKERKAKKAMIEFLKDLELEEKQVAELERVVDYMGNNVYSYGVLKIAVMLMESIKEVKDAK